MLEGRLLNILKDNDFVYMEVCCSYVSYFNGLF